MEREEILADIQPHLNIKKFFRETELLADIQSVFEHKRFFRETEI